MPTEREIAIGLMTDAAKAVGKTRGPQHGDVAPSFQMIADFWSTWINNAHARRTGIPLTMPIHLEPGDVLQMMSLLKKARALHGDATLADHYADDIGYTGLAGGLAGALGSSEQTKAVEAALEPDPHAIVPVPEDTPIPEFLTRDKKKAS